jgi:hypothetical protein
VRNGRSRYPCPGAAHKALLRIFTGD